MTGKASTLTDGKSVTVRSLRKPGHWWVDNEVLDMFGDDLGCYGIAVYAVLARLCYSNSRVTVSQRDLAAQARVSQTELRRRLEIMINLGLLAKHDGGTERSKSTYDLMDVKDLVEQIKAAARERGTAVSSAPPRLRRDEGAAAGLQGARTEVPLTNRPISSSDAPQGTQEDLEGIEELDPPDLSHGGLTVCASQAQMGTSEESAPPQAQICTTPGSDLSLGGGHLRQPTARVINGQYPRHKTQDQEPTPTPAVVLVEWAKSVQARITPLGIVDAKSSKRILADARKANPDVSLEEILFWIGWLADKAERPGSGILEPGGYVIRMVGECVAGGQYAQLKAGAEQQRAAEEARDRDRQRAEAAKLDWETYRPLAPVLADTTWRSVCGVLEKEVLRQSFETWIKPTRGLDAIDGKLYVRVPTPEFLHIGEKYGALIQAAIDRQNLKVAAVLFVARPEELPWRGPGDESP